MLGLLLIKNFALIQNLELEPAPGFTVLSGETGAGKSIILSALNLLLGAKAGNDLIRQGEDAASVEALFYLSSEKMSGRADLAQAELLLKRTVNREGRNRVQVNGEINTLNALTELSSPLISLCGQHSQQSLLKPEEHLVLLDEFVGQEDMRAEMARNFKLVTDFDRQIAQLQEELSRRKERELWLKQIIEELEAAQLNPEEEETLKAEHRLLHNAGQRAELSQSAYHALYGAEKSNILSGLHKVLTGLRDLSQLDESLSAQAKTVEECYYILEDTAYVLRDYNAKVAHEPGRLDWIEERISLLQRLARRHGGSVASALERLQQARQELDSLDQGHDQLQRLALDREKALQQAVQTARQLSEQRKHAAPLLVRRVEEELKELGMANCKFEVRFFPPTGSTVPSAAGELGRQGLEGAEFYLAPNPGEGFRPLARTASGGELSRLLLALRGLSAGHSAAPTLVFDEVDAGVGGDVGLAVGRKLARLARGAQVICITHLPQIAAFADRHYRVSKQVNEGRTSSNLTLLEPVQRVEELGRMLGHGDSARRHAQELLTLAAEEKMKTG
jgi:DNA repair protein RecN (Recombination protein N)